MPSSTITIASTNTALKRRTDASTHWSVRDLEEEIGISKSTVQRYLKLFGVQPHGSKSFKLSRDPFFIEKLREVVGLYLNPPNNALVLCVDEKSQILIATAESILDKLARLSKVISGTPH